MKIVKFNLLVKQVLLNVNLAQMEPLMVMLVTVLPDGYGNGKDYIVAFVSHAHQERTRQNRFRPVNCAWKDMSVKQAVYNAKYVLQVPPTT